MSRSSKSIIVEDLGVRAGADRWIFRGLNAAFARQKTGLVGRNGVGKTTLFKVVAGLRAPDHGKVRLNASVRLMPQHFRNLEGQTVAQALNIDRKVRALRLMNAGKAAPEDFESLGDDWEVEERSLRLLESFGLHCGLDRLVGSLSGGERVKLGLCTRLGGKEDFLLLDEPTNNLDREGRERLYERLESFDRGLVVVSHDRELLERMDGIVEMNAKGAEAFGGNFSFYFEEKQRQRDALEADIRNSEKELRKARLESVKVEARKAKQSKTRKTIPHIAIAFHKNRSEKGLGKSKVNAEKRLEGMSENLEEKRGRQVVENAIYLELPHTQVGAGREVIRVEGLTFGFSGMPPMFDGLDWLVKGPERVVLRGRNGSGKTTFIRLLRGELRPGSGSIQVPVPFSYVDQHTQVDDEAQNLLESVRVQAPELSEAEIRKYLARFLFSADSVFKPLGILSGGERLKAVLSRELIRRPAPQLLILDEPTNDLDLDSIQQLESALACFEGAMLVVSHDEDFIKAVGVTRELEIGTSTAKRL